MSSEPTNEDELRRYLMLVSYSGMGVDSQLDLLLKELRDSIKNKEEISDVKSCVDNITNCLRHLEEKVPVAESQDDDPFTHAISQLVADLQQQDITHLIKRKLASIKKNIPSHSPPQLIEQVKELFVDLTQQEPSKSGGWSLFGKKSKDKNLDESTPPQDTSNVQDQLPESLIISLRSFISQLSTIDIYKNVTEFIAKELDNLNSYEQLSPLIDQIATALLEAASQEHVQFEAFLKSLNKRLLNVASFLNQAAVGQEGLLADTDQLDVDMKQAIDEIQNEIDHAIEASPLKEKLVSSFQHIFSSINRFKDAQKARIGASIAELKIVREQLKVTEDEAERLKQNILEQRFRAYTDQLTQLPNRYAYNERLTQEYTRWRRYRGSLALAVGDIDFFKKINDQLGHSAGDDVLKKVAEILQSGIRESDFIARYGGEEFVILMPETDITSATKAINKLRQQIKVSKIKIQSADSISTTISFGVAQFEGTDTATDVFSRADKALYRAKAKGRDQVCAEKS